MSTRQPHRDTHLENYVGIPLEERLRKRLEDFLAAFPDAIQEEEALAMLLDLGLERADSLPWTKRRRAP